MYKTIKNKKIILPITILLIFAVSGLAYASLTANYSLPQTATAPIGASATFTINGQPWTNGTAITWGQLVIGVNTIPITVTNTGSVAITSINIVNTGLPAGWTETIALGTPSGSSIPGTITLNADASVTGQQSWASVITISGP
ncbi:MAG: hypothetical protein IMZ53_11640 [Thermoplasmata archaeon]|nr:hypothetical protein [Thermoplasmata archaeon]